MSGQDPFLAGLALRYFGSIVRHFLTAIGGALVSIGVLPVEQQQAFADVNTSVVIGLILFMTGQAWSWYRVKQEKEKEEQIERQ